VRAAARALEVMRCSGVRTVAADAASWRPTRRLRPAPCTVASGASTPSWAALLLLLLLLLLGRCCLAPRCSSRSHCQRVLRYTCIADGGGPHHHQFRHQLHETALPVPEAQMVLSVTKQLTQFSVSLLRIWIGKLLAVQTRQRELLKLTGQHDAEGTRPSGHLGPGASQMLPEQHGVCPPLDRSLRRCPRPAGSHARGAVDAQCRRARGARARGGGRGPGSWRRYKSFMQVWLLTHEGTS